MTLLAFNLQPPTRSSGDSGNLRAALLAKHAVLARHLGLAHRDVLALVPPDRDLERAVAARCVGDRDARLAPLWMLQLSPPAAGRWGPRAYATAQSLNTARHRANRPCRQCVGCAR